MADHYCRESIVQHQAKQSKQSYNRRQSRFRKILLTITRRIYVAVCSRFSVAPLSPRLSLARDSFLAKSRRSVHLFLGIHGLFR